MSKSFIERLTMLRHRLAELPVLCEQVQKGVHGPFPAPSAAEIKEAQTALGIAFPEEYLALLTQLEEGLPPQFSLHWIGSVPDDVNIIVQNEIAHSSFGADPSRRGRALPSCLVAFGDNFALDVFAFDCSQPRSDGAYPVVVWHDMSVVQPLAADFGEYLQIEINRLEKYCESFEAARTSLANIKYRNFEDDLYRFVPSLPTTRPPFLRFQQGEHIVWRAYTAHGNFDVLISEAHRDYAFADDFLNSLSDALVATAQGSRLKRLWKGVIAQRMGEYRATLRAMKQKAKARTTNSHLEQLDPTPHLNRTLDAMRNFAAALDEINDTETAEQIRHQAKNLADGKEPTQRKLEPDKRPIDEDLFWELIEGSKNGAAAPLEQVENLTLTLEAFSASEIKNFQKVLDLKLCQLYHWDVWAVAYIRNNGCSDDGFEYFRAGLIMLGRDIFEAMKRDVVEGAQLLPLSGSIDCEPFLYVAQNAYEAKRGEPMKLPKRRVCSLKGKEWNESTIESEYPSLWSIFHG